VAQDGANLTCRVREASVAGSWAVATAVVPGLAAQKVVQRWCGVEAETFDGVPLIGPAPGLRGLFLALGFCGHGFQIAPAVGRTVADALQGRPTPELDHLSPARLLAFDSAAIADFKAQSH
jgi:sarcosine oxidase subunit beta